MKRVIVATVGLVLFACGVARAQSTYKLPPPEVVKILDATPTPIVVVSPTSDAFLLVDLEGYPPIRQLARPILRLAGVRVDPGLGALQRTFRSHGDRDRPARRPSPEAGRVTRRLEDQACRSGRLPGPHSRSPETLTEGVELWVVDAAKGQGRAIPGVRRRRRPQRYDSSAAASSAAASSGPTTATCSSTKSRAAEGRRQRPRDAPIGTEYRGNHGQGRPGRNLSRPAQKPSRRGAIPTTTPPASSRESTHPPER